MASSTPYDDAFKTILHDCSRLILPVINELFQENYTGNELIEFLPTEYAMKEALGKQKKRIVDSNISVMSVEKKHYHIECQSEADMSIIARIFEYNILLALKRKVEEKNHIRISLPKSALIYLKYPKETPSEMMMVIEAADGSKISQPVPILKIGDYTLADLMKKNLVFLLPFYIFTYEKSFRAIEHDTEKMKEFTGEYQLIVDYLGELFERGLLNQREKSTIMEMTLTVVNSLAKNFENVKKGVDQIMGGNVIYTETRRNYEQGMSIGHAKGHTEGEDYLLIKTICSHMNRGKKLDQITDIFDMVEPEKIQRIYNLSLPFLPAYDVRQIYELLHEEDAV